MPNDVPDLWNTAVRPDMPLRYDARPVAGLMAPFVGRRYTEEEVWQLCCVYQAPGGLEEDALQPLAARIRAFDVPVLARAQLVVSSLAELPAVVYHLLLERLLGWQWDTQQEDWQRKHLTGVVKKYAHIHTTLHAPDDETTQQPMVLELFGRVLSVNGQPVGIGWFKPRQEDRAAEDALPLGEISIQLQRATYANTRFPGIGIPFYS